MPGEVALELRGLCCGEAVRDIDLTLRAGEILGIAGLIGSGRTELALTIFGITPATSGEILVKGKPVSIRSPSAARRLGIAYVPEDRGLQGLIRPQTLRENVSLTILDRISRLLLVDRGKESALARDSITRFGIRARGPEQIVRQLSGGNQQKVVLAKWVATEPKVLIMDEPTRGIDVGAKAEIHALMSRLAGQGLADPDDLQRAARGARHERPGAGHARRPDRAGLRAAGCDAGCRGRGDDGGRPSGGGRGMTARIFGITGPVPVRRWARFFESYGQELVLLAVDPPAVPGGRARSIRASSAAPISSAIFAGNAYIAVAAIGMSMVIISGHIDVSVGSLIGVLATISGTLAVHGYPIIVAWLAPLILGMAINAFVGVLIAYARIPSIVVDPRHALDPEGRADQRHRRRLDHQSAAGLLIAQFRLFGIPSPVYFMVVLTILAALWARHSGFGRTIYAIGGNPEAARVSGIRIKPSIVTVFAIHGLFAGIAAVLFATQLQVIQSTVPPNLELTVITASVVGGVSILGGTGTVIGSTLAAILFATIGSSLIFLNVSAYWLRAVQGLLILATVLADMARRHRIRG